MRRTRKRTTAKRKTFIRLSPAGATPGYESVSEKTNLEQRAYEAGLRDAERRPVPPGFDPKKWLNALWNEWLSSTNGTRRNRDVYAKLGKRYVAGYRGRAGQTVMPFVPVPTRQSLAAVVTVMNEEQTLPDVLEQLNRLPLDEIVIVVNGSTDGSFSVARRASNAVIVHFPQPLGHDVGRAIGAKLARSDLLLFLDGDIPVGAEQLVPFVAVLAAGADIALNDISPYIGPFGERDAVTVMKEFLNRALGRPDLQANSLTAVPHAMSRKALETIGYKNLIVPPLAQTIAIRRGLNIECAASVDVVTRNRIKTWNAGDSNPVSRLIVGDHVEALSALTREAGSRLDFPDSMRVRRAAGGSDP